LNTPQAEQFTRSMRKARGSGHLRRAELLAAAERIFNSVGYEGATIRKIAEEVGVSSTALYMYFEDKSQIMLEICLHALEGLHAAIDERIALDSDPLAHVRIVLEEFLRFGFEKPTAYQLLYCAAPKEVDERRRAVIAPLSRQGFARTQEAVEAAMAAGRLRSDLPPRAVTEAMIAACHGAISMRLGNPQAQWIGHEVLSRTLLEGLFNGFTAA
jgi:AcrR family transcriptional regulator